MKSKSMQRQWVVAAVIGVLAASCWLTSCMSHQPRKAWIGTWEGHDGSASQVVSVELLPEGRAVFDGKTATDWRIVEDGMEITNPKDGKILFGTLLSNGDMSIGPKGSHKAIVFSKSK